MTDQAKLNAFKWLPSHDYELYLTGSHTRNEADEFADIDLICIWKGERPQADDRRLLAPFPIASGASVAITSNSHFNTITTSFLDPAGVRTECIHCDLESLKDALTLASPVNWLAWQGGNQLLSALADLAPVHPERGSDIHRTLHALFLARQQEWIQAGIVRETPVLARALNDLSIALKRNDWPQTLHLQHQVLASGVRLLEWLNHEVPRGEAKRIETRWKKLSRIPPSLNFDWSSLHRQIYPQDATRLAAGMGKEILEWVMSETGISRGVTQYPRSSMPLSESYQPAISTALRSLISSSPQLASMQVTDAFASDSFELVYRNQERLRQVFGWVEAIQTPKEQLRFLIQAEWEWHLGIRFHLAIHDPATRAYLGALSIHTVRRNGKSCEIGYWIDRDFEGKGIISRCVDQVRSALHQAGVESVRIQAATSKPRSAAIPARLGFKPVLQVFESRAAPASETR